MLQSAGDGENSPFTFEIIMCLTLNWALECAASIFQLVAVTAGAVTVLIFRPTARARGSIGHSFGFLIENGVLTALGLSASPLFFNGICPVQLAVVSRS